MTGIRFSKDEKKIYLSSHLWSVPISHQIFLTNSHNMPGDRLSSVRPQIWAPDITNFSLRRALGPEPSSNAIHNSQISEFSADKILELNFTGESLLHQLWENLQSQEI